MCKKCHEQQNRHYFPYGRIIIINCYYYDVIVIVTVCRTHINYLWSCADSHHLSYESPSLNCLLGHSSVLSLRTSQMTLSRAMLIDKCVFCCYHSFFFHQSSNAFIKESGYICLEAPSHTLSNS